MVPLMLISPRDAVQPGRHASVRGGGETAPITLLLAATLVLWVSCAVVGVVGLVLHYPRPQPPRKESEPVAVELLNVQITQEAISSPDDGAPSEATELSQPAALPSMPPPPPLDTLVASAVAPALVAVAVPSPAIAFAMPVEGPTRTVDAKAAVPVRPEPRQEAPVAAQATATARPAVGTAGAPTQLTFGEGEGKQPAPEYPREAIIARQVGTVVVRFTVGTDGRVKKAEATKPCSAALLNQSALRTVRESWRFSPGVVRVYEVSIEFELKQK